MELTGLFVLELGLDNALAALLDAGYIAGELVSLTRLRPEQCGTPPDQASAPLDEWANRAHEPHHKEATVQRFHNATHDQLRTHLADFVAAYNFARRLKTLKGLTPYEFICKRWTIEPERFRLGPLHQMPGLNSLIDEDQPL